MPGARAPYVITTVSSPAVHYAAGVSSISFTALRGTCPIFTDMGEGTDGRLLLYLDDATSLDLLAQLAERHRFTVSPAPAERQGGREPVYTSTGAIVPDLLTDGAEFYLKGERVTEAEADAHMSAFEGEQ